MMPPRSNTIDLDSPVSHFRFPYSGNGVFFRVAGPTSPVLYREALINADELVRWRRLDERQPLRSPARPKMILRRSVDGLQQMALWIKNYNESLRNNSLEFIHSRRDRLQRYFRQGRAADLAARFHSDSSR